MCVYIYIYIYIYIFFFSFLFFSFFFPFLSRRCSCMASPWIRPTHMSKITSFTLIIKNTLAVLNHSKTTPTIQLSLLMHQTPSLCSFGNTYLSPSAQSHVGMACRHQLPSVLTWKKKEKYSMITALRRDCRSPCPLSSPAGSKIAIQRMSCKSLSPISVPLISFLLFSLSFSHHFDTPACPYLYPATFTC